MQLTSPGPRGAGQRSQRRGPDASKPIPSVTMLSAGHTGATPLLRRDFQGAVRRASVALCSGTIRLADPGRNAVTARHHSDGEEKEHEKEERQEQGDHVVPASFLLGLMRPQVCLTAHCVPLRNGKREGRASREPAATPARHLGTMVPFRRPEHNPAPSERRLHVTQGGGRRLDATTTGNAHSLALRLYGVEWQA
jgi:hypothetical protein